MRAGQPGWLPAALNRGWTYRERVAPAGAGMVVSAYYATRHHHSDQDLWRLRLAAGEIEHNGVPLRQEVSLAVGDRLAWNRPAWLEGAVPAAWGLVFDDGDLHVIDKPAGLPVLPAGGWLEHTVLRLLERRHAGDPGGIPRPVHRLGRFTSGLLVCARRPQTRAWLSALLRESTAAGSDSERSGSGSGSGQPAAGAMAEDRAGGSGEAFPAAGCGKRYRALLTPGALPLAPGASMRIEVPIGRRPHPQLGQIWCAADGSQRGDLSARSVLTLLQRGPGADLVEVGIASGRPHQIRIHCAAVGAPLLGDPLYGPGGGAAAGARPGEGGYRLQAWRLELERAGGGVLRLEVEDPLQLTAGPEPLSC